jgi:hypothetical protein
MNSETKNSKWSAAIYTIVVGFVLNLVAVYLYGRSAYNWDMFPYMILGLQNDAMPYAQAHAQTFYVARSVMPAHDYEAVLHGHENWLEPSFAKGLLPFYTIKPAYV